MILYLLNILYSLYTSNYEMKDIFYKILDLIITNKNINENIKKVWESSETMYIGNVDSS